MEFQMLRPHQNLADYINSYFFMKVESESSANELVIPDGTHGLMIVQQSNFIRHSNEGENKVCGSFAFGQKSKAVNYQFDSPGLFCFGVKFQPHGLARFIKMPVGELKDRMVDAPFVLGKDFKEIEDKTLLAKSTLEKKYLLDNYFIQKLQQEKEKDEMLVHKVLEKIHHKKGKVEIANLLSSFQLNYKRLERLFKKYVGISPKAYCRIVRFNATLFYHSKHPEDNLTQLAYSAGYFDQMHFIKEVKHFTQLTPKAFFNNGLGKLGQGQQQLVVERLGAEA